MRHSLGLAAWELFTFRHVGLVSGVGVMALGCKFRLAEPWPTCAPAVESCAARVRGPKSGLFREVAYARIRGQVWVLDGGGVVGDKVVMRSLSWGASVCLCWRSFRLVEKASIGACSHLVNSTQLNSTQPPVYKTNDQVTPTFSVPQENLKTI